MNVPSYFFCDTCGAANAPDAITCFACACDLQTAAAQEAARLANNPPGSTLVPGKTVLRERYRIICEVGKGGFGSVYQAEDSIVKNRIVAIKEIVVDNLSPLQAADAIDTFQREARLLSTLAHPNLPYVYSHFMDHKRCYLVMEFIPGETLDIYLSSQPGKYLPLKNVFKIGLQLCTVLEYLHSREPAIIFRDVKPANVIIHPDTRQIHLIDFGTARRFAPGKARDTTALGSPGFAAPEQYGKAQSTVCADIYGLGATLHQLLTGHDPSENPFHFDSLRIYRSDIPPELNVLVQSMLEMDAMKRPESMTFVKDELQRIEKLPRFLPAHVLVAQQGQRSQGQVISLAQVPQARGAGQQQVQMGVQPQKTTRRSMLKKLGIGAALLGAGYFLRQNTEQNDAASSNASAPNPYIQRPPPQAANEDPQITLQTIYEGHTAAINAVAIVWIQDDMTDLMASGSDDQTVQVWDTSGEEQFTHYGHSAAINSVAWLTGTIIASASDDSTVQAWDVQQQAAVLTYRGHKGAVQAIISGVTGQRAGLCASAGVDKTVQIWDPSSGQRTLEFRKHTKAVNALAASPDGRLIASAGDDGKIYVWNPGTGSIINSYTALTKQVDGFDEPIIALAWSPDGETLAFASADGQVQLVSLGAQKSIREAGSSFVYALAWSPDSRFLAMADTSVATIWDVRAQASFFTDTQYKGAVTSIAWSSDGSMIVSGSRDTTAHLWNVS